MRGIRNQGLEVIGPSVEGFIIGGIQFVEIDE